MAKSPVDVSALLGNLLKNLDKGVSLAEVGKKEKVKKEKTLLDESMEIPRLHKPSLTTTRLVLRVNRITCECCGAVVEYANKHVLVEKVDKHGNLLQTRFISEDDMAYPREFVYVDNTSANCLVCFESGKVKPVLSEEAWDSIEPVNKPGIDDLLALIDSKVGKENG